MSAELLDEADPDRVERIFRERFDDPASFTFYFVGNMDLETAKPLIEKYLGGLPRITKNESWKDHGVRAPEGMIIKQVVRQMEVPKATVNLNYSGTYDYDIIQNRLNLAALCEILDIRYTETIREEQGGTYGVAVYPMQTHYPFENYRVIIFFDCDPENTGKLKDIVYQEIEKLKTEGPTDKDLHGVKENKIKVHQENLRQNNYWINIIKNKDYYQTDLSEFIDYEEYVNNMTRESMKAAAQQFFSGNIVEGVLLPVNIEDNTANPGHK